MRGRRCDTHSRVWIDYYAALNRFLHVIVPQKLRRYVMFDSFPGLHSRGSYLYARRDKRPVSPVTLSLTLYRMVRPNAMYAVNLIAHLPRSI
jgi:hypothetical protein